MSPSFSYTRLADSYCQLGERHGIARSTLLDGTGVVQSRLDDPDYAIGPEELLALARRGMKLIARPTIGIEHGLLITTRNFGFLGYAALSGGTLQDVLGLMHIFFRSYAVLDVSTRVEEGWVVTEFAEKHIRWHELLPAAMDSALINFHRVLSGFVPDLAPLELRLSYPEAPYHALLRELVAGTIRFDGPTNEYRFPASFLAARVRNADPTLTSLVIAQHERELRRVAIDDSILSRVRDQVVRQLDRGAERSRVARELGMSSRTLQRRLGELGVKYYDVVEQARCAKATDLLSGTDHKVDEVALQLGYSDPANFRRAFRRWVGVSPSEYRSTLGGARRRAPAA